MQVKFERTAPDNYRLLIDGESRGWVSRDSHKPTGLHAKRYFIFSVLIGGERITANTLTALRPKIITATQKD